MTSPQQRISAIRETFSLAMLEITHSPPETLQGRISSVEELIGPSG